MGATNNYDHHWPNGHQPGSDHVYTGEIVLPAPKGRERRSGRSQHQRAGNTYGRIMDEDLVRDVIDARVVKKWTLQKVADTYGVSMSTVSNWCKEHGHLPPDAPNVLKIRAEIAAALDVIGKETWRIHEEAEGAPKVQLDALARLESIERTRGILHGANAPVRHDVTLTAVTEAERELQEMIREAQAKQALKEAAVIQAASEDPDL